MDTSGPEPEAAPPAVPFVPNGKKPKGAFKTWKTEKKTESTYRERRAKRVEAAQAAVATKRGLVTDGNRWVDAHTQFTTGEEAFVDDEDANTETTWEEISYDQVREAVARQILAVTHNEIDPAHLGTSWRIKFRHSCMRWLTIYDFFGTAQKHTNLRPHRNGMHSTRAIRKSFSKIAIT